MACVAEMDGVIFTDDRVGQHDYVDVYRESWFPKNTIAVKGDKGQIAAVLNKPALLFDDKEENVALFERASPWQTGFVVKRGRKARHHHTLGFFYEADPRRWLDMITRFAKHHRAISADELVGLHLGNSSGETRKQERQF